MLKHPFYDPTKSYQENFEHGPFGELADGKAVVRKGQPKFQVFGQPIYTPFGIPAGPLPTSNFVSAAFNKGFDICTYKTVRTKAYPVHPQPNILAVKITGDLTP